MDIDPTYSQRRGPGTSTPISTRTATTNTPSNSSGQTVTLTSAHEAAGASTESHGALSRPSGFRGPHESSAASHSLRDRLPPINAPTRSILNPIDDARSESRRLPSLHSVLSTPLRRDTTSPERYSIASRSPTTSDQQLRIVTEPVIVNAEQSSSGIRSSPWQDPNPHSQRSNSPLLAPIYHSAAATENRRYSQPAPQDAGERWMSWSAPLAHSLTNPESRPIERALHEPTYRLSRLQSQHEYAAPFTGPTTAPMFYEDPRRDSARVGPNPNMSSSLGAKPSSVECVGQADIPGKGLCYVYQDGSICPTVIDDLPVNPAWGTTKAGKPRKRLAQACLPCREKKIRCEPRANGCSQCEKAKRQCKMPSAQQQQAEASSPAGMTNFGASGSGSGSGSSNPIPIDPSSYAPSPPHHGLTSAVSMPDFRSRRGAPMDF